MTGIERKKIHRNNGVKGHRSFSAKTPLSNNLYHRGFFFLPLSGICILDPRDLHFNSGVARDERKYEDGTRRHAGPGFC